MEGFRILPITIGMDCIGTHSHILRCKYVVDATVTPTLRMEGVERAVLRKTVLSTDEAVGKES